MALRRGLLAALLCLPLLTLLTTGAAAQTVSFASGTYRVTEGDALMPEFVLSHARSENVTVRVETLDLGGAQSGVDFASGPWSVTVQANARSVNIPVTTVQDTIQGEGLGGIERFSVRLSTSEPGIVFGRRTANVSISDYGTAPRVTFAQPSSSADEGAGTHQVTVILSPAPRRDETLWVRLPSRNRIGPGRATTDVDYEILPSEVVHRRSVDSLFVTVPAGATTATVPVTIIDDAHEDSGETIVLTLVGGTGYRVGNTYPVIRIGDSRGIGRSPGVVIYSSSSITTRTILRVWSRRRLTRR